MVKPVEVFTLLHPLIIIESCTNAQWLWLFFIFPSLPASVLVSLTRSRNSLSEITVVVWRTGPSVKSNFEGLVHHPTYKSSNYYDTPVSPAKSKRVDKAPPPPPLPAHHRTGRRVVVNGSDGPCGGGSGAGILWGERRSAVDGKTGTQTLRGTRVKASNGDDYIILSPINPGSQVKPSIVHQCGVSKLLNVLIWCENVCRHEMCRWPALDR